MIKKAALALALGLLPATFARAQGVEGYDDVGARLGFVDVDHYGMTYTLGVFADFGLAKMLMLDVGLDYFDDSKDDGDNVTIDARDVSLSTLARFVIPSRSGLLPFVEAGLSLHMVRYETDIGTPGHSVGTDNRSGLGLDVGGGVLVPSRSSVGWLVEAVYRQTPGDLDVDHLMVTVGVTKAI